MNAEHSDAAEASTATASTGERRPTHWQLAAAFLRYANFTLGGGSATTAVIHHELVASRGWLDDDHFTLSFALARVTPGTNVLAFCTGVGWMLHRLPGAVLALLAASIPSSLMAVALTMLLAHAPHTWIVTAAMQGAVAAAVAITARTGWTLAEPHFRAGAGWRVAAIGGTAFAAHAGAGVPSIDVLLLAGAAGALLPVRQP